MGGEAAEAAAGRAARIAPTAHLLVTGGAGFIGSAYVREVLGRRDGARLDKLTYAGNRANLATVESDPELAPRLTFVQGDIADAPTVEPLVAAVDAVVNFAAESHVDRSILDPEAFLRTGVIGVHVLLEAVRVASVDRAVAGRPPVRFLQVSTDEVYGAVLEGRSREGDPVAPRSPYSAAKAAGELLESVRFTRPTVGHHRIQQGLLGAKKALVAAFRQGLRKLGWTEGHNVRIDIRYSHLLDDLLAIFLTVVGGLDAPGRHRIKGCVHPRCAPL